LVVRPTWALSVAVGRSRKKLNETGEHADEFI
jgi:hypothetical protein